ncbi:hypothetical protein KVR01_012589 [Diaporthe batatas]|uniref:uncharacterized protein n=1 Tax=Diaporthe batatas TaxID=748121 RepID=UPI001D0539C6|nr:uncharacterized protein KVR01_012589 [Diaporthe batatas]KAG8157547.1 hypothetical protein KVR01_012589 [Diaporthe batatas]
MSAEKTPIGEKIRVFFLGDEAKTKEERKLVRKIDRAAFANAYVAGLREDLNMKGHDYNTVLSVTTAGSVNQPFPDAACKTVTQLCVVRFFLGVAEASTYAGTIYIIGSWYKPKEISKRTAIFTASGQVGTMFAGVMMTAIYKGMGGLGGLQGWKWVFLIDGIITLPIALFGFFYFPDIPENTTATYLNESERKMAVARLPPIKEGGHSINPFSLMKRLFLQPFFWILVFWSPVCATLEAYSVQNNFLIWLKYQSSHFSQSQINTYPLGVQAVGIASNMLAAWHMDATGTRVPMAVLAVMLQLVCAIMLLVPTLPFAGTFFAFYLSGTAYMVNPLIFGWASIILQRTGDDAVRSVTVYCMNVLSLTLYTFWGIVKGGIAMVVCCCVMLGYVWVVWKVSGDGKPRGGNEKETADMLDHSLISLPLRNLEIPPSKRQRCRLRAREMAVVMTWRLRKKATRTLVPRRLSLCEQAAYRYTKFRRSIH